MYVHIRALSIKRHLRWRLTIFSISVRLHGGIIVDDENKMRIFIGIGTMTNTGNKGYHQWILTQCSSMVTEYLEYSANTEYYVF